LSRSYNPLPRNLTLRARDAKSVKTLTTCLSKRYGIYLDAGLSSEQREIGLAWRRTFEEHFHQVLEWELFEHPAGAAYMRTSLLSKMPPMLGPLLFSMLRSRLRTQLYGRGLARHTPDIIEAKGRADVD
jgi:hypothetical protein